MRGLPVNNPVSLAYTPKLSNSIESRLGERRGERIVTAAPPSALLPSPARFGRFTTGSTANNLIRDQRKACLQSYTWKLDPVTVDGRWSRRAVDKLGERLRAGVDEERIREIDLYRQTFWPAYRQVGDLLHSRIREPAAGAEGAELSGRFGKTTYATVAKLQRMTIRLSQMQDIAGFRIVVATARNQDQLVQELRSIYPGARIFDRRNATSHGYRAVHAIVNSMGWPIEVQVRTVFQHLWAQLSERLADTLGAPEIKYGDYPEDYPEVGRILSAVSRAIAEFEDYESDPAAPTGVISKRRRALLRRFERALQVVED
jgi:GTP pyrophosphokinase